MSEITVIIPTYNRPDILQETISNLTFNLRFDGHVSFLIGDDGNERTLPSFGGVNLDIGVMTGPKRGLGANLNMLIQAAKTDIVLQMDDDHHLVKPLDITQYVKDLEERRYDIGWIRLFLGTEEDLNNDAPFYTFTGHMMDRYWIIDPRSDELYIASNRPHLKLKEFHQIYGMYDEGVPLGQTESEFCHRYKGKQTLSLLESIWEMAVAIPVAAPSFDTWEHVGDSWQKQGL